MIDVSCNCGLQFELPEHWAGKQARCPGCRTPLRVPAISQPAPPVQKQPPPVQKTQAPPVAPAREESPPVQTPQPQSSPPQPVAGSDYNKSYQDGAATTRPSPPWLIPAVAGGGVLVLMLVVACAVMFFGVGDPAPTTDGLATAVEDGSAQVDGASDVAPADDNGVLNADGASTDAGPATSPLDKPLPRQPIMGDGAPTDVQPADGSLQQTPTDPPATLPRDNPVDKQPGQTIELSGQSRRFDDRECVALQNQHGVRIPATADMIEVDGQRLPLSGIAEIQQSVSPVLLLPKGVHTVRFRRNENPFQVKIDGHFIESYHAARAFFGLGGKVRDRELLTRAAWAYDSHRAPLLLNFQGASYAGEQKWEAASRKFRRALRVNPTFAPAHLNLAHCLMSQGDLAGARREIELASAFNIGNVYGIAHPISNMLEAAEVAEESKENGPQTAIVAAEYFSRQPLSVEDQRVEAMLLSLSKYAVRHSERGKIINNLAAHFADKGNTDAALEYYRAALEALKLAAGERLEIARRVLENMAAACQKAGYEEAAEYQQMRNMVTQ